MGVQVVNIFGFWTINITRDIEVVFVFFYLAKADQSRKALCFSLFIKNIDNFVNILLTQVVFIAIFGSESIMCFVGRISDSVIRQPPSTLASLLLIHQTKLIGVLLFQAKTSP